MGKLDFLGATISFLDLRGVHISRSQSLKNGPVLNLNLARVRDNFSLGNSDLAPKTIVEGPIEASAMTIGGEWDLRGLTLVPPDFKYLGIQASNLRVGRDLKLGYQAISIDLTSSHVEHNLSIEHATMEAPSNQEDGLLARNITIGNDCNLEAVSGTVNLELARIGGALKVCAQNLASLNAKDAEVRGSVSISGTFMPLIKEHRIRFDGGSYRSGFRIGDSENSLRFINVQDFPVINVQDFSVPDFKNAPKCNDEWIPTLSIEDACIANDFQVTKVRMAVVPQYRVIEACKAPLSFYSNWVLVEVLLQLEEDRKAIIAFLKYQSDTRIESILLGGQSTPIHLLNGRGTLKLDSAPMVRDYLRFFCAYVWGEEGAFLIIEAEEALGGARLSTPVEFAEVSVTKDEGKGWICIAMIRYANKLYRTKLHVNPDGNVEMTDDDLLADIEEEKPIIFESPLRIKADPGGAPFWLRMILPAAMVKKLTGEEIAQDVEPILLQQLVQPGIQENEAVTAPIRAEISLRGLKARVFHHNLGLKANKLEKPRGSWGSWGSGIRLKLDGFEYDRVETVILGEVGGEVENLTAEFKKNKTRSSKPVDETADAHIRWLTRQYDCPHANHHEACDQLIACAVEANSRAALEQKESVYEPQPYEQLARALHNEGKYEVAKRITLAKLSLDRQLIHHVNDKWGQPFLYILSIMLCIMEKWFDYGLFPKKSVGIFAGLLIVGTIAFYTANHLYGEPVLVRHAAAGTPALCEQRCGEEVNSFFYALDVLVPLLDLKQEDRCSITARDDGYWWRLFNALYELFGAIVAPITVLSVTGMLRRYIER
ncbi:MAG: hypothetical protein ABIO50_11075 [Nitrosospira sp.]